jgi:hypothetical protein
MAGVPDDCVSGSLDCARNPRARTPLHHRRASLHASVSSQPQARGMKPARSGRNARGIDARIRCPNVRRFATTYPESYSIRWKNLRQRMDLNQSATPSADRPPRAGSRDHQTMSARPLMSS